MTASAVQDYALHQSTTTTFPTFTAIIAITSPTMQITSAIVEGTFTKLEGNSAKLESPSARLEGISTPTAAQNAATETPRGLRMAVADDISTLASKNKTNDGLNYGKFSIFADYSTTIVTMRIVIQRVSRASVTIDSEVKSSIGEGYLILVGIEGADTHEDADWLVHKVIGLRVFEDEQGVMNRDILSVKGEILVVSQFTLFASYKKGNRPAWFRAATHDVSVPLYNYFCARMSEALGKQVGTGEFGADMKVELVNDGPVTICMDTKNKE